MSYYHHNPYNGMLPFHQPQYVILMKRKDDDDAAGAVLLIALFILILRLAFRYFYRLSFRTKCLACVAVLVTLLVSPGCFLLFMIGAATLQGYEDVMAALANSTPEQRQEFAWDVVNRAWDVVFRRQGHLTRRSPPSSPGWRADSGAPPAKPYLMAEFPVFCMTQKDLQVRPTCTVCNHDFKIEEEVVRLPCSHVYHDDCITSWLVKRCTCPMCRWELPTDDQVYEKGRLQRMKNKVPRYYAFELERASAKELKELLKTKDSHHQPVERKELIQRLIELRAIELIVDEEACVV